MGLFEEAGRRFERFKREAEAIAEGEADYECKACEARVYAGQDRCPDCGSDDLVPIEPSEDTAGSPTDDGQP